MIFGTVVGYPRPACVARRGDAGVLRGFRNHIVTFRGVGTPLALGRVTR